MDDTNDVTVSQWPPLRGCSLAEASGCFRTADRCASSLAGETQGVPEQLGMMQMFEKRPLWDAMAIHTWQLDMTMTLRMICE